MIQNPSHIDVTTEPHKKSIALTMSGSLKVIMAIHHLYTPTTSGDDGIFGETEVRRSNFSPSSLDNYNHDDDKPFINLDKQQVLPPQSLPHHSSCIPIPNEKILIGRPTITRTTTAVQESQESAAKV